MKEIAVRVYRSCKSLVRAAARDSNSSFIYITTGERLQCPREEEQDRAGYALAVQFNRIDE